MFLVCSKSAKSRYRAGMGIVRKVLRLDPDQARTLAMWLRTAAAAIDERAAMLSDSASTNSLGDVMRKNAARERAHAKRARALAARLDPAHDEILRNLDKWDAERRR